MRKGKNFTLFSILSVLLIALFAGAVAAEDYFTVDSADKALSICSCGQKTIRLLIKNYESVTAYYTVDKSGSAYSNTILNEASFSIDSGKTKAVDALVNFDCSVSGNYDLKLTVSNDIGVQRAVDFAIKADKCENIKVAASQESIDTCSGKDAIFEIAVGNPADFTESYSVGSSLYSNKVTFSQAKFELKPQESGKLYVKYSPAINEVGKKVFDFVIVAEKNQITGKLPLTVNVNKCHDFDVWLSESTKRMLACQSAKFGFTVENHAKSANDFEFSVIGPEWVKLSVNGSVKISPNDKKTIEINANAPCDASGIYTADISANVKDVSLSKSSKLKLIVYPADQGYRLSQPWFKNIYEEYPYHVIGASVLFLALLVFLIVRVVKTTNKKLKEAKEKAREKKLRMLEEAELELKTAEDRKKKKSKWLLRVIFGIIVIAAVAVSYYVPVVNKFVMDNKIYVGIGILSLAAIFLIVKIIKAISNSRHAKKEGKNEKEMKKVDSETEKRREELKQIESHVTKAIEKKKKPKRALKFIFIVFLIAIVCGLGYIFVMNNLSDIEASYSAVVSLFAVKHEQAPAPKLSSDLMSIDTKNLKMEGNTIIIDDQTSIPLIVESKKGKTSFSINSGVYWMKIFNGNVEVQENDSQVVYIQITPDKDINGKHFNLNINAAVSSDDTNETRTDSINLDIKINAPYVIDIFSNYASYIVLGLLIMIICILMINAGRRGKSGKNIEDEVDWRTKKVSDMLEEKRSPFDFKVKNPKKLSKKNEDSYVDFKVGNRK